MEHKEIITKAQRYGACHLLSGTESPQELARILISAQGLEFYQKTKYPTHAALRPFKEDVKSEGVIIDAGDIDIRDAERVLLVGNTRATLYFDDMADVKHNVTVMHGAKAHIVASNWAVVFVKNLGGDITVESNDNTYIGWLTR